MASEEIQTNGEINTTVNLGSLDEAPSDSEIAARAANAKMTLAAELVAEAEALLGQVRQLIQSSGTVVPVKFNRTIKPADAGDDMAQVVEGVFDGQKMIGPDGKHYSVPANYASKSKLVEGDLLKLTITAKGAFVYKQIGPIARRRLRGALARNESGHDYSVRVQDRSYRVLTASVTYFHGHEGDEVVILVPETGESKWAAVENIIRLEDSASLTKNLDFESSSGSLAAHSASNDDPDIL